MGDEGQVEGFVDSLFQSRLQVQVGLLIGKSEVSPSRDSVFALVPTPRRDGGGEAAKITGATSGQKESSGKKNAKPKPTVDNSSVDIDTDWVAEHSRQVSRMLVGGMDVVGIFVYASESALKNSISVLWQTVRAVASASPLSEENDERLVLNISSSPRRISCRSCAPLTSFSSTALRPCDWKLGKLLSNLQTYICSHPVEVRIPLLVDDNEASAGTVKDNLCAAISAESARLKSAVAMVDGTVPSQDALLAPPRTLDNPHVVEYLAQLDGSGGIRDIRGRQNVAAMVTLSGVVHGRAYASAREPLQRAITNLEKDLISSLRSRLDLLCDEAERSVEDDQCSSSNEMENSVAKSNTSSQFLRPNADAGTECSVSLPRRVFVPWHSGTFLSDYLVNDETLEMDVKVRFEELFSFGKDLDISEILQPELSAVVPPAPSFSQIVHPKRTSSSKELVAPKTDSSKQVTPPRNLMLIGALGMLLLAILLALFMSK